MKSGVHLTELSLTFIKIHINYSVHALVWTGTFYATSFCPFYTQQCVNQKAALGKKTGTAELVY